MIKNKDNTNKKILVLLIVMLALFTMLQPLYTYGANQSILNYTADLSETVVNELDQIDFSGLNDVVAEFQAKKSNLFSIENIKSKVYSIISGEDAVSYSSFFASLFSNVIELIISYLPMLSIIIAVGVLSNLLNGIKSKFNEKSTSNLIELICFMSVVILVGGIITTLTKNTGESVGSMVKQMNLLFPILLSLMVGLGANASVGVFQPVVAILSTYIADFFNYFVVALFMLSFVFGIVSNMSTNVKLDKFSAFISSLFKWCVGVIFTLFFAVFSIQGISAGSFDSVSIRTTKYTIKSYVPVMGGYLSDGMDLILSSTVLIKNSIGLVGLLMIISTIISPILEIIIFSLVMKLVSAILQPMGNTKISNFLSTTSKSVTMLSTAVIAIGFMYLLSIGLVMTTANVVL